MGQIRENGNTLYIFEEALEEEQAAQASEYWTEERIRSAIPIEQIIVSPEGFAPKHGVSGEAAWADATVMPFRNGFSTAQTAGRPKTMKSPVSR